MIDQFQKNVILSPYTTYKIGGPADYFFIARTLYELRDVISFARNEHIPYFILGTGANILISDKGFQGLVIKNESKEISFQDSTITIESGATVADVIDFCVDHELSGFEHFAGIPSTIGGALWQNLHFLAPNRVDTFFIESIFISAELLDEKGDIISVDKDFFNFGYDYSILHDRKLIVLSAVFSVQKKSQSEIQLQADENRSWRNARHPNLIEFPSCGSVFKKIEGIGAGRLIEQSGLKGIEIGGAQVSTQHANFIVNTGNATAADVLALILLVQETVFKKTGHTLETEIGFIGEF